jgi:hypothetical protein
MAPTQNDRNLIAYGSLPRPFGIETVMATHKRLLNTPLEHDTNTSIKLNGVETPAVVAELLIETINPMAHW